MDEVLNTALEWAGNGAQAALATVTATWGSSPLPVGSQMAVNERGHFAGSLSGGCIESFVVSEAIDILQSRRPRLIEYGVSDKQAQEVKLACGGTIRVFVEPAPVPDDIRRLLTGRPIARIVDLATGEACLLDADGASGALALSAEALEKAQSLLHSDSSGVIFAGEKRFFQRTYAPPRRIVIIGAVHIAQALIHMMQPMEYAVTVVDPRPIFTRGDRVEGVEIITQHPARLFEDFAFDARTALVALAHDPDLDDPAIRAALRSDAFYIGALGGRRNNAKRLERLAQSGFPPEALARIHAPIGLDIGGRAPAHIAVSILAEIIAVANGRAG